MDPDKPRLVDIAKGTAKVGGSGLPSPSTSYPYPPNDPGAQPIQYPQASAPREDQWDGYQNMHQSQLQQEHEQHQPTVALPPQPEQKMQPHPQQTPPQAATSFPPSMPQHQAQAPQQNSSPDPTSESDQSLMSKRPPIKVEEKSLLEAYILCLPLGFLGLHHFYLGRIGIGFLYFFTFGVFGIGWIIDWFRLPWLVKKTNEKRKADAERGYILYGGPFDELYERSLCSAYMFWLPPVGIFGGHHYYLGRFGYGVVYSLTMGLFGVGWLFDLFRIWILTRRANQDIRTLRSGRPLSSNPSERMHLDDAYSLAFPLGFLGLHHFYMRRWMFGVIYFLTLGCMGVGFLVDLCRMPYLFYRNKEELKNNHKKFHVDDAYLMWFPLGILGMHHFYLHRWGWGFAYFFTFGLLGIGWLIDICRIPRLVRFANERRSRESLLGNQYNTNGSPTCHCEGAVHPDHGSGQTTSYQSIPEAPGQGTMLVYAFPLDQYGHPIWSERSIWTQDTSGRTDPSSTTPTHWQPGVNSPGPAEPATTLHTK
ncbi:uncharacterized protein LOC121420333 [Lytechinus variegatus]|uniref:uncharacterized protein LOC121420333 n=1 Tax=Lytechinus variegatus TaxID=7654 RepID=UPI001BB20496|nr:uncharacterized protein LOC121420333 [Lytechinus variegatus]